MSPLGDTGGRAQETSAFFLKIACDYNYLKNDTLKSRFSEIVLYAYSGVQNPDLDAWGKEHARVDS